MRWSRRGRRRGRSRRAFSARSWRSLAVGLLVLALYAAARTLGERGRGPSAPAPAAGVVAEAAVERVVDGDTAVLRDGRTLRYLGIDAPEAGEPGYDEASEANRRLVAGRRLELEIVTQERSDRHGRLLGVLSTRDPAPGLCVNVELVRGGWAWVYQQDPDSVPPQLLAQLLSAQAEALVRRAGVWARLQDAGSRRNLVSTRLRIHRATCAHVTTASPRPVLSLEAELGAGKSPCRECRPVW